MILLSRSPAETEAAGYRTGRLLKAGRSVLIYGELGAGKTAMVKGIASAFGINPDDVTSPTFTIVTEYESVPRFVHMDLYRITGSNDLESTGIWDSISDDTVSVIEWPEKAEDALPEDSVVIRIRHTGQDEREIEITGVDEEDWNNLQA